MLGIQPGFPFTKTFGIMDDGVRELSVVYGPPEAGQLIHIKKITVSLDIYSLGAKDMDLFIDFGTGWIYADRLSNPNYGDGTGQAGTMQTNFDFYLTEGQKCKVISHFSSSGYLFNFNIFGEVCYISNMVEVGD